MTTPFVVSVVQWLKHLLPRIQSLPSFEDTIIALSGGEQAHWWTKDPQGKIIDPTAAQFPSLGMGIYEEFNGVVECAQCGKEMKEEDVGYADGNYAFCGSECFGRFVGVY